MLDKQTLDRLAEMRYLQEKLDELRKQKAPQVHYDDKTTPIEQNHCSVGNCPKCNPISPKLARSHYLSTLLEYGFIDGKEFVERV